MTLIQEANLLMQNQPDSNLRIIVDMLRAMNPTAKVSDSHTTVSEEKSHPYRLGILKNKVHMPEDSYDHFDDDNEEIWKDFNEDSL